MKRDQDYTYIFNLLFTIASVSAHSVGASMISLRRSIDFTSSTVKAFIFVMPSSSDPRALQTKTTGASRLSLVCC